MSPALPLLASAAVAAGGGGLTEVDWTLTIATWVTFGLLAFVLAKFAWGPIVAAIDARERTVREHVERAEGARAEAERLLREYEARLAGARRETEGILAKAREDAERVRRETVARAEEEARARIEKALRSIEEERAKAEKSLRRFAAEAAVSLAAKVLKAEIDAGKHRRLLEDFARQ